MSSRQIMQDLGAKIAADLQEKLEREMRLASQVLAFEDLFMLMLKIGAGVGGGTLMLAMVNRKDGQDPAEVWDTFAELLFNQVRALKPLYLDQIAQVERSRANSGATL